MYDRAIGPVKEYSLQVFKINTDNVLDIEDASIGKSKHKSYYINMRKAALMQHGKEAYKKLDKILNENLKYDFSGHNHPSYYHVTNNTYVCMYVCMYVCVHSIMT